MSAVWFFIPELFGEVLNPNLKSFDCTYKLRAYIVFADSGIRDTSYSFFFSPHTLNMLQHFVSKLTATNGHDLVSTSCT